MLPKFKQPQVARDTVLDSASLAKELSIESHSMARTWKFWDLKQVGPAANLGGGRHGSL